MAFRFNEAVDAIAAFAEDYRVATPRWLSSDLGDGDEAQRRCGRLGMTLGQPVMSWLFQQFLYNLRDYIEAVRNGGTQYRPAQALRRSASGSSTTMSRADRMMRVKRCSVS